MLLTHFVGFLYIYIWKQIKYPLSNELLMTEASNKYTHLITNFQIKTIPCILRISGYLLCTLCNIPTVLGIRYVVHGCEGVIYVYLIVINIHIGLKLFCGGGGIIEFDVRGRDRDKSYQLVDIYSPCTIIIWVLLMTQLGLLINTLSKYTNYTLLN